MATTFFPYNPSHIWSAAGWVVNAVLDAHPGSRVAWMPRRDDMVEFLARELRAGDVCISMGCGDIATLPDEVIARRAERRAGA